MLIGHRDPRTGLFEYMTQEGGKSRVIDVFELEQRAAEAGVLLLAIGCRSAYSTTFGSERDINSVEVLEDLASGITAISTGKASLRALYGALATERMALSIDLLSFKDTRRLENVYERGNVLGAVVGVPPVIVLMSSLTESAFRQSIFAPSPVIVPSCPDILASIISARFLILWMALAILPFIVLWEAASLPETGFQVYVYVFGVGIWIHMGMLSASEGKLGYSLLTLLLITSVSFAWTWSLQDLRSRWCPVVGGVLAGSLVGLSFLFAFLCGPTIEPVRDQPPKPTYSIFNHL